MAQEEHGWYDHSIFYRFRARGSIFLFGCTILILPFLCVVAYAALFLYPLCQMTFGRPIPDTYSCVCFVVILVYTIHWIFDSDTPFRGGRSYTWFRRIPTWRWVSEYFPARLVASDEMRHWAANRKTEGEAGSDWDVVHLPTDANYLVGYHPHGPLALGGLMSFGCDCLRLSEIFPGIKPHMASLNLHYNIPFYRDYAMLGGEL